VSLGGRKFLQSDVLGRREETMGEVVDLNLPMDPLDVDSDFAVERAGDQSSLGRTAGIEAQVHAWAREPRLSVVTVLELKRFGSLLEISAQNLAGGGTGHDKTPAIIRKPKPSGAREFLVI